MTLEYWLVDWPNRTLEIYRSDGAGALQHVTTLAEPELLRSPLLPGFEQSIALFLSVCHENSTATKEYHTVQPLAADTAAHIEADLIERLRRTPAWRKLQMISELHHGAARLVPMGIRGREPQASEDQRRYAEAVLWFGADQIAALWPRVKETFRLPL